MHNESRIEMRRSHVSGSDIRISASFYAILGFGAFIAWISVLTWNPHCLLSGDHIDVDLHGMQIMMFLSMACISLVVLPFSSLFLSEKGMQGLLAFGMLVFLCSCGAFYGTDLEDPLSICVWIGWGAVGGVLLVL